MESMQDGETEHATGRTGRGPFRRILGAAVTVALAGLAAGLAALVIPGMLGYQSVTVRSGSMGPTIPTGSLVLARSVAAGEVHVGDVVLIRREDDQPGGLPYLHRVVGLEIIDSEVVVQTKGDANRAPDPNRYILTGSIPVTAFHVPRLGYLVAAVSTKPGWVTLVVLPGSVLCAAMLFGLWWPKEEDRRAAAPSVTIAPG